MHASSAHTIILVDNDRHAPTPNRRREQQQSRTVGTISEKNDQQGIPQSQTLRERTHQNTYQQVEQKTKRTRTRLHLLPVGPPVSTTPRATDSLDMSPSSRANTSRMWTMLLRWCMFQSVESTWWMGRMRKSELQYQRWSPESTQSAKGAR